MLGTFVGTFVDGMITKVVCGIGINVTDDGTSVPGIITGDDGK